MPRSLKWDDNLKPGPETLPKGHVPQQNVMSSYRMTARGEDCDQKETSFELNEIETPRLFRIRDLLDFFARPGHLTS